MTKLVEYRVQVTRVDDTGKPKDDEDYVGVLDINVQVPGDYIPSSGYGAAKSDAALVTPEPLTLQQQIRAALEAARPGQ